MKHIEVKGSGLVKVRPDRAVLSITLSNKAASYLETIEMATQMLDALQTELKDIGLAKALLKSDQFYVNEEYESREISETIDGVIQKRHQNVLSGFRFTNRLSLDLSRDTDELNLALTALANSQTNCEFSLSYQVGSTEKARKDAVAKAILNAKEMALFIADQAAVTLGDIHSIRYGTADFDLLPTRDVHIPRMAKVESLAFHLNVEPDDITVEASVLMTFDLRV